MVWLKFAKHRLAKLRQLSASEACTLVQASVLLPLTVLALRLFSFKRCHSILAQLSPLKQSAGTLSETALRKARLTARNVEIAARLGVVRARCLPESLVLWWLLRRQGLNVDLRIGTRKVTNQLEAHAWVEHTGIILNEAEDVHERFKSFDRAIVPGEAELK